MLVLSEAAERLGLRPVTLRTQIKNGVLKARRLGSQYVVTEREVERYRREHLGKVGPKPRVRKTEKNEPGES